ncbi:MAG TPA: hypothetical protein VN851_10460 [Thermoanaerobaculia bacterium]|nr:hypothetical protein [Thermoanaerobaculia bacterium]
MKKATPRSTRLAPTTYLDSVVGGTRAQIIEIGGPTPSEGSESDVRTQIIDIG